MFFNAFFSGRKNILRANKRQTKKRQRSWLEIQLLEDRCTPAGLSSQALVTQAYKDLFQRAVDPSGLATWSNFIDLGAAPAIAALGIVTATSQEFHEVEINQLYSTYLGRAPVAGDAATWLSFLSAGGTYHQMVVLISSSDEAFTKAGGTNDTWLSALFTNALGRSIDTATQTQLDKLFTNGLNRAQIDTIVLNTTEYYAHLVQTTYQQLLNRPADGASANFQVNALQAGFTYEDLVAGIVGSPEFGASASGATTTTVVSSVATAVATQPVTFTATITANTATGGLPTGTVTFLDGASAIGTGTIAGNGQATFTTSGLTPGAHTITASYSGDSTFGTSTGTTSVTVNAAATTTQLTTSGNTAVVGQSVTFSATVSVQAPGSGFASGTVTFKDQTTNTSLGTGTINAVTGVATLAVTNLALGNHSIVATYVPGVQATFAASTSNAVTQTISQSSSTTAVSSSVTPSAFGQQVTFTATVTATAPGSGSPTGTVTFTDTTTGTSLGTGTITAGKATVAVSTLTAGSHTISASYGGDTNFSASTGTATQVVNQAVTTTAVTSSAPSAVFGQSVTLTAKVTPTAPGAGIPTGMVTFTDENNNTLGTGTLDNTGSASINASSLAVGGHTISVNYAGDANFASSGGTAPQTITKAATTTALASSLNPAASGATIVFTATIVATAPGAGIPTGSVTFVDMTTGNTLGTGNVDPTTGLAVLSSSLTEVETHTIVATYSGDADFTTSNGSVDQVIT